MKRKFSSLLSSVLTKRPKTNEIKEDLEIPWIPVTSIFNHILRDPLVDWLKCYHTTVGSGHKTHFLFQQGKDFERYVVNFLSNKVPIKKIDNYYTDISVDKTISEMKKGTPVLYSAPLKHNETKTYGIADLLVRSDYLWKLVNNSPLTRDQQHK